MAILLAAQTVFVACEYALIRLRYSHFNTDLVEKLAQHPKSSALLDKPDQTVRLLRLGISACTLGYGLLFYPVLATFIGMGWPGYALALVAFVGGLSLHFVVGELVPRGLSLHYPWEAMQRTILPVKIWGLVARPVVTLLSAVAAALLKACGVDREEALESLDVEAQLSASMDDAVPMEPIVASIVRNALDLKKLTVGDALLPRNQLQWFDVHDSVGFNLDLAKKTGHTRFPLCEGSLDKCIGLIHIKDIFRYREDPQSLDLRRIKRPVLRVGQDESLSAVLELLLRSKAHMALAVDEFGGTAGVITLENIIEEIVGDIQDEFDTEEANIKRLREGEYLVSGLTPLHDLEKVLDVELDNEEASTLGGLITAELGHIPVQRTRINMPPLHVVVTEVDEKRVIAARVTVQE